MAYKTLLAAACIAGVAGQSFVIDDATYSHEWMSKAAMPVKRSDMTATTVGDGIYIIGGCTNDQEYSTGAQMWGTWSVFFMGCGTLRFLLSFICDAQVG